MFKKNKTVNSVQDLIDVHSIPPNFIEFKMEPVMAAMEKIDNLSRFLSREVNNLEYHSKINVNGKSIEVNITVVSSHQDTDGESESNPPSGEC